LTTIPLQNKLFSFQREIWQKCEAVGANDFEGVVFAQHPELRRIRNRLQRLGASPAAMTGSGSAIFGLFDDPAAREKARLALADERVFPISFLSRAAYRSLWTRALGPHIKKNQWPPQSLYAR
jgi:4-diphosphocytidyl-2C-methyl-D-erythritol kinase